MRNHSSRYLSKPGKVNESMYGLFSEMTYRKKDDIRSVTMIPTDKYIGRVYCDGNCVYASHSFTPNDIPPIDKMVHSISSPVSLFVRMSSSNTPVISDAFKAMRLPLSTLVNMT